MEKEKKVVKKAVKKEPKVVVKEEKKSDSKIIFPKQTRKIIKFFALALSFIAVVATIFTFIFAIITSLKVANNTKLELLHDNFSVTFISNINGTSIAEAEDLIQGYGSKALFIIFDIVIPAIAIIAASVGLIIFLKKAMDFINENTREKDLFTEKNLENVEKLACLAEAIITVTFVVFDRPSILLYAFICILLYIIIFLFKKCINK